MAMLEVRDLHVQFRTDDGLVKAVDGLSFNLERGRTLGIVGESGSGKSVTSLAIMGLHRSSGKGSTTEVTGQIRLDGEDLVSSSAERVRQLRGSKMAMIFQDPLSALNPYYSVGAQISEAYRVHNKVSKQVARKRAIDLLGRVGIPQPTVRVDDYPHQFSGGMRQRVMIAMALSCDPELILCDEPTTALDVTIQDQILRLLVKLCRESGTSLMFVTHDLPVVAQVCHKVAVMYAGRIVERGTVSQVFSRPMHPYTLGLLRSAPDVDRPGQSLVPIPGSPPSLIAPPSGCRFHPRCKFAEEDCKVSEPPLRLLDAGRATACLHYEHCLDQIGADT